MASDTPIQRGVVSALAVISVLGTLIYAVLNHWLLLALEAGSFLIVTILFFVAIRLSRQVSTDDKRILNRIVSFLAHEDPVDWIWGVRSSDKRLKNLD